MSRRRPRFRCVQAAPASMTLLPPASHLCPECAWSHPPAAPHNAQTMFYRIKFEMENHRAPTWWDAMAHCSPETQNRWIEKLAEHGITVTRPVALTIRP